jgi:hypothetical protein
VARTSKMSGGMASGVGVAVRVLAPVIPLGIALVHSALVPGKPPNALVQQPGQQQQVQQMVAQPAQPLGPPPSLTGCGVSVPCPLMADGQPVMWWFVFKLSAKAFPGCGGGTRTCPFDGSAQPPKYAFGQQYAVASSASATLVDGVKDCLGTTKNDPVGASFAEVYNGSFHYAIWNDQPYADPKIAPCSSKGNCDAPWGHSKGMVAWNDAGEGFVMQVSTPSWPESGSAKNPRKTDGNTLGCVRDDDVELSQHFFALRLTKSDLVLVLQGLANASVVTDPTNPQVVSNGGPADVQALVNSLGKLSKSEALVEGPLSSGVMFLSKPSDMNVPPWQMVSAQLGGVGLRTATFWASPKIPTTTSSAVPACWDEALGTPGPVAIATTGVWDKTPIDLEGTDDGNHAKIGVATSGSTPYAIFGDENQQGVLSGTCSRSQNGRGGTFYVVNNAALNASVAGLIQGATGSTTVDTKPGSGDASDQ